jgi:hypothetical protein
LIIWILQMQCYDEDQLFGFGMGYWIKIQIFFIFSAF